MHRDLVGAWTGADYDWGRGSGVEWLAEVRTGSHRDILTHVIGAITIRMVLVARASATS